jgi:hypothetical protein
MEAEALGVLKGVGEQPCQFCHAPVELGVHRLGFQLATLGVVGLGLLFRDHCLVLKRSHRFRRTTGLGIDRP